MWVWEEGSTNGWGGRRGRLMEILNKRGKKKKKSKRGGKTERPPRACIISLLRPNSPASYIVMHIMGAPQRFIIDSAIK